VPSYRAVNAWVLLRRPLILLLVLGCGVSMAASGRFSARLIADGMISFAFVPIVEVGSLALVWRAERGDVPFARAVDLFCASDAAWMLWIVGFTALRTVQSPLQAVSTPLWAMRLLVALLGAAALWAFRRDLQLFRTTLAPARPVRALLVQRLVAWTCAVGYFLGIAIWANIVGFVRG
jgi:hypothetical protein